MSNPLGPVWNWYEIARDSMRVSHRILTKRMKGAITQRHVFHALTSQDAIKRISEANQELDNMAVVAMVAVFERALRDHVVDLVQHQAHRALSSSDAFSLAIWEQLKNDIEFWHLSGRLIDEVCKKRVDANLCGMVKQIIDHRNEVAHGHFKGKPPPAFVSPPIVFQRLSDFLRDSKVI